MVKNIIYIYLVAITFYGCEDVIDIDVPIAEPKLVIEASINQRYNENDSCENCWVKLTLTTPFFDENVSAVTDAEVKIIDITNNITYDFINESNTAYYYSNLIPEFNTDYKLQVIYNYEVYESNIEQLMPTVPIDNLVQGDGTLFGGDEIEVITTITDIGSRDDFYLFKFSLFEFLTSEDEFYQGNTFSFSYFYDNVNTGDEITIEIFGIDERYNNYMNILIELTDNSSNPFQTTPTNAKGNIINVTNPNNYPLGYFRVSKFDKASIIIEYFYLIRLII